ncbi:MAG: hypothetical protein DMF34_00335 [Verrucomicrobia bacterium]|nr:MAG: hypothetical protein DMF34_00335 [Verrucomicrobiota bacterium]
MWSAACLYCNEHELGPRETFVYETQIAYRRRVRGARNHFVWLHAKFAKTAGTRHTFDSFECAIHALAPVCPHCDCRVIGHGVEQNGKIFCCVNCARAGGKTDLKDRV